MKTKIEWADESWNPIKAIGPDGKTGWHCIKIAPECRDCYAALFNMRRLPNGGTGLDYVATSPATIYLDAGVLNQALEWKRPRGVFPCSMTDWCGEFVDPRYSAALLAMASMASRHTFLFLTKRPARMLSLFTHEPWQEPCADYCRSLGLQWTAGRPLANVWLGFSAGTQRTFDAGVGTMSDLAMAGWNTWCSCEPMLEAVNFRLTTSGKPSVKWIIFGGESGNTARPFDLDACRDGLQQCEAAGIPAFLKQLGRHPSGNWGSEPTPLRFSDGRFMLKSSKGETMAEWPPDLQGRRVYPFSIPTT